MSNDLNESNIKLNRSTYTQDEFEIEPEEKEHLFYTTQYYKHKKADHIDHEKLQEYLIDPNVNTNLYQDLKSEADKETSPEQQID